MGKSNLHRKLVPEKWGCCCDLTCKDLPRTSFEIWQRTCLMFYLCPESLWEALASTRLSREMFLQDLSHCVQSPTHTRPLQPCSKFELLAVCSIDHIILSFKICTLQESWDHEGFHPDFKGRPRRSGNVWQDQSLCRYPVRSWCLKTWDWSLSYNGDYRMLEMPGMWIVGHEWTQPKSKAMWSSKVKAIRVRDAQAYLSSTPCA
jgi:hypothetical protein